MYNVVVEKKKQNAFEEIGGETKIEEEHLGSLVLFIRNRLDELCDDVDVDYEFNDYHKLISTRISGEVEGDIAIRIHVSPADDPLDSYRSRLENINYYIDRSHREYLNQTS